MERAKSKEKPPKMPVALRGSRKGAEIDTGRGTRERALKLMTGDRPVVREVRLPARVMLTNRRIESLLSH